MKKFILPLALLLTAAAANAQTSSDNVTLNVKLYPIQTLVVNSAQNNIDLEYKTITDYANGVTSGVKQNHLSIYSTGGYQIKVKSSGADLSTTNAGVAGQIAASTIKIVPTAGAGASTANATYTDRDLSATDQILVSSTRGGVDEKINIDYQGKGANAYIDHYVANQNPTVYTTTVTYTIIPQ